MRGIYYIWRICCELDLDYPYHRDCMRERERVRVCVCVCVWEREGEWDLSPSTATLMPRTIYNMLRKCLNNGGQCQGRQWAKVRRHNARSSLLYKYTLWKRTTTSPPCCLSQADGPGHVFNIMLVIWPVAADRKNWDFYLRTTKTTTPTTTTRQKWQHNNAAAELPYRGRGVCVLIMASGDDYTIFIYRNYYHLWYPPGLAWAALAWHFYSHPIIALAHRARYLAPHLGIETVASLPQLLCRGYSAYGWHTTDTTIAKYLRPLNLGHPNATHARPDISMRTHLNVMKIYSVQQFD